MRILIVGDLSGYLTEAAKILLEKGGQVTQAASPEEALRLMRAGHSSDVLLVDIRNNIPDFLERLKSERFYSVVVGCGFGTVEQETVLAAIRAGAKEYIPLPPDAELIAGVLEALLENKGRLIYQDEVMRTVLEIAQKIAPSEASVLITGESGTGKEVMARYIHDNSLRKSQSFISVNCAAIPENLLESELFGHEKGAFTGALARRIGKFEEANGGTLLLDEISEMHPRLQAKLLRAIQEREIDRVGGSKPVKVNIRLLATSNRNLKEAIREGQFREDLYFRLNVIHLEMPPLKKRPKDIGVLAEHFVDKYLKINGLSEKKLSPDTLDLLTAYPWPGNVRELENTIHRAILLCPDTLVLPEHLGLRRSDETDRKSPSPNVGQTLAQAERNLILSTLEHCVGDYSQAAHVLGLSLRSLRSKMKDYEKLHGFEEGDNSFSEGSS